MIEDTTMTVFKNIKADDKFSRLCSALHREAVYLDGTIDDIHAFGAAGECFDLIDKSYASTVVDMLNEAGYTPDSFDEELRRRTSDHVAHFNFSYLVQL
jgi:hypothetical protein